ncbi:MAG: hypothetical protein ACP5GZ_00520 [Vulcanisaeta sp.]|jgi:hypothetical protein|uniref:Uncharacterized protein n=1 Tax=Vulcanisaeta moutnovskia (strain 768-28) TaxID=985053 RepID=F0QTB2_VULM7|nr:hypothetical protein [Vulcanisaeta moutnovskia]ADY00454.1 hypothetical protein VMUT_0239 [Vulcanisaeta moutnovskia 768-28]
MVVELAKGSTRNLRRFLRKLNLAIGKCFDDIEFTSLLRSVNSRYGDDYWLLGWKEHKASDYLSLFVLTLIDKYNEEYVVRIYVNVSTISIVLPTNQLNLTDETTGITMLINGNTANLSGRVFCITNIEIKRLT